MNVRDYLKGKSEEILISGATGKDGCDYAFDLDAYMKKKAKKSAPGTLMCVNLVPWEIDEKLLNWKRSIYKIRIITIEEYEEALRTACMEAAAKNIHYVIVVAYRHEEIVYDTFTDRFCIVKSNELWKNRYIHARFKDIPVTPFSGAWYVIDEKHKANSFSLSKALQALIKDNSLEDALFNFKGKYIYMYNNIADNKEAVQLSCYSKKPKILLNGEDNWFSLIRCDACLVSSCANPSYVKEHRREILEDIIHRIEKEPRFIKSGIPINFLKVGKMVLTKDDVLSVTFQLKIETDDDIYNC